MDGIFTTDDLIDPTVSDPCVLDPDFPPEQFVTHFISEGSPVHATVWIAQGQALKGTVILSPQWYGGDRLESVIIPLMTAGINVMTFHPRGMWDNQHRYTLTGAVDDLLAAAAYVRSTAAGDIRTPQGRSWRTDPARIAVMGLSGGGGNVGIAACAEDPGIRSVIAIASNSMMAAPSPEAAEQARIGLERTNRMSAGRIDVEGVLNSMTPADYDRMRPTVRAAHLVHRHVLLIGAHRDTVAPLETCHKPIARAMRDAGVRIFDEVILDCDHGFLTKRIALSRLIIQWLRQRSSF